MRPWCRKAVLVGYYSPECTLFLSVYTVRRRESFSIARRDAALCAVVCSVVELVCHERRSICVCLLGGLLLAEIPNCCSSSLSPCRSSRCVAHAHTRPLERLRLEGGRCQVEQGTEQTEERKRIQVAESPRSRQNVTRNERGKGKCDVRSRIECVH